MADVAGVDNGGGEGAGEAGGEDGAAAAAAAAAAASEGGGEDGGAGGGDDWRAALAGDDKDALDLLSRYSEPGMVGKTLLEQRRTISQNEAVKPLAEDATEEQVAQYREANGIPTEPTGYWEGLPEGLVIGEEDEAGMAVLAEKLHGVNADPKVAHAAAAAYYEYVETQQAERLEADKVVAREADEALDALYGAAEAKVNKADLVKWLGGFGLDEYVLTSRGPDGNPLGSNTEFMTNMIAAMREIDPVQTVVPNSGSDPYAVIDTEIETIEKTMKNDFKTYSADKAMQARYLELINARDKRSNQ